MAEGTRLAKFEDILSKITGTQDKHNNNMETLTNSLKDLSIGLQTLDAKVEQSLRKFPQSVVDSQVQDSVNPYNLSPGVTTVAEGCTQHRTMRLDVPWFSGENVLAWLSRIQRYFDFYVTPDPQHLLIASFHLDGDALDWYDWMSKNQLLNSWHEFLIAVEKCFGPSEYEDYLGKLSKLIQTGTLATYQHMFEQLANKIPGVPEHVLVSCFNSGLRAELHKEIHICRPQSLVQAMSLLSCSTINPWMLNGNRNLGLRHIELKKPLDSLAYQAPRPCCDPVSSQIPPPPKPKLPTNIQKLSATEMAARREKGLCFNCDEKL